MPRLTLALATTAIAVLLATPSHATLNACSAGKKQCVSKKTAGLLKCHILAEKAGLDPVSDPAVQGCAQKARDKFDGGADPSVHGVEHGDANASLPPSWTDAIAANLRCRNPTLETLGEPPPAHAASECFSASLVTDAAGLAHLTTVVLNVESTHGNSQT